MTRFWLAIAVLSGSWLLGLGYFFPAQPVCWLVAVLLGVGLLSWSRSSMLEADAGATTVGTAAGSAEPPRWLGRREAALVLAVLLPAVWLIPWPYKAAPLLTAVGMLLTALPLGGRRTRATAVASVIAGVVLAVQAAVLTDYAEMTARSHELPRPLPEALALLSQLFGIDAAAVDSTIVVHTARQMHRLAATWELLVDPVSLVFFFGGVAGAAVVAWAAAPVGSRWSGWLRVLRVLALVMVCWLPLRAVLLVAVYVHRVVRFMPEWPLHAMNHIFSPWSLMLLAAVPALLVARFARPVAMQNGNRQNGNIQNGLSPAAPSPASAVRFSFGRLAALGAVMAALAGFAIAWPMYWNPAGERKPGRVMFVERKSQWEPTTQPYDTGWFVEPQVFDEGSGYNYYVIFDWLSRYYETSRLMPEEKIDRRRLADCDVLVIKTPTQRYTRAEIEAVHDFVEEGGSLLLIGDHTNVFHIGTVLNDIARPMGFVFRPDLLFGLGESAYEQRYVAPWCAHPIVQHLPPMDFAVSCSIDPGRSAGRAAVRGMGLFSMGPEYHVDNFHPVPQHCPQMRCGAFVQVWATTFGRGRVAAFTDSTIFSNFCLPQDGKADMMFGLIEWLNHREPLGRSAAVALAGGLSAAAVLLAVAGAWLAGGKAWLLVVAAGLSGWALGVQGVSAVQRMNIPPPEPQRAFTLVAVDRSLSDAALSKGPYTTGGDRGFGLAEQWIQRPGYFVARRRGMDVFSSDAIVVFEPRHTVSEEYRQALIDYVAAGGRLIVVDTPENTDSTANSLLWPFGLSMPVRQPIGGRLKLSGDWPGVSIEAARPVEGGETLGTAGGEVVAALARHGEGAVLAIGCGSAFNDKAMGETWMMEPSATVRTHYDAWFALLRRAVEDTPIAAPPPRALPDPGGIISEQGIKE